MHKDAEPASQASMCVAEQGKDKFWKFHDIAFAAQDKLDTESLVKHAKASGADEKKFKECFESKKYAEFVKKDMAYGEKLGVRSTPTFFVNGQLLSGALPIEQFSEVIDEELESAK
jgi:protein-disulfide isomerase